MADDDLQQHLNNSIYGPPQTNPDERRQYLGSLRERVFLRVRNQDIELPRALTAMQNALTAHQGSDYKLLINGKMGPDLTAPYMTAASKANIQFTMVNDGTANLRPEGSGVLLVARQAINQPNIDLPALETPAPKPEKKGWFHFFS